jgi:hypothetical protein
MCVGRSANPNRVRTVSRNRFITTQLRVRSMAHRTGDSNSESLQPQLEERHGRHRSVAAVCVRIPARLLDISDRTLACARVSPICDERPDDVHIVGRNASPTTAARFLVFLVKDKGAPVLTPVK